MRFSINSWRGSLRSWITTATESSRPKTYARRLQTSVPPLASLRRARPLIPTTSTMRCDVTFPPSEDLNLGERRLTFNVSIILLSKEDNESLCLIPLEALKKPFANQYIEVGRGKSTLNPLPPSTVKNSCVPIFSWVLSEFTHGNSGEVSKSQFKEVLSDILLGMAAGLKRDPIVILRIDGQDLSEFLKGPGFEPHAISVFSQIESTGTMLDYVESALHNFSVDHGMPPPSDPWVTSKVIEPALEANASCLEERNVTQEGFVESLKKVIESIALHLKEDPVIVAHSGNTFDGSSIKRLLSNKYELDKAMETTWKSLPKDRHERMSKEYLRVAYDIVAPAAGLPPYGAVNQVDEVVNEVFKMVKADEAGSCNEAEFNKLILEILGDIMLQLEGNPVTVSSNAVVNEPEAPTFLPAASNHGESE
ncbi:uncharacterized protein LOC18447103 isoform X1 [Amborella trichopoda]|uniref:uncharacterized protein LOC18447103 isoform X1 n=2 Tax=Amborella trichopoda TaxID=13333 RepID=UPI0009BE11A1|nr:uncharacterized protein LOC18447103 isoform X1 [Amborella trichopoda]|eukprot:XP_020530942.1 uncharacterized protein LOC18447103 isoform X1 [Amborella trichopoda]